MPTRLRQLVSLVAGAGFIFAAVIVLQYQEVWAPRVDGVADRLENATTNLAATMAMTLTKARAAGAGLTRQFGFEI